MPPPAFLVTCQKKTIKAKNKSEIKKDLKKRSGRVNTVVDVRNSEVSLTVVKARK